MVLYNMYCNDNGLELDLASQFLARFDDDATSSSTEPSHSYRRFLFDATEEEAWMYSSTAARSTSSITDPNRAMNSLNEPARFSLLAEIGRTRRRIRLVRKKLSCGVGLSTPFVMPVMVSDSAEGHVAGRR